MSHSRKLRVGLVAGAAVIAASPVTVSSSGRIQALQACADGTCCTEDRSICFINDIRAPDAYYKGTGSCLNQT